MLLESYFLWNNTTTISILFVNIINFGRNMKPSQTSEWDVNKSSGCLPINELFFG